MMVVFHVGSAIFERVNARIKLFNPYQRAICLVILCGAFSGWQINEYVTRKYRQPMMTLTDKEANSFEVLGIDNSMPTTMEVKKRYKQLQKDLIEQFDSHRD